MNNGNQSSLLETKLRLLASGEREVRITFDEQDQTWGIYTYSDNEHGKQEFILCHPDARDLEKAIEGSILEILGRGSVSMIKDMEKVDLSEFTTPHKAKK